MEKTFVNVLAYSRALQVIIILVLVFIVFSDALAITIVIKIAGYTTTEERAWIDRLIALLLLSSASGFVIFYLINRSLKAHWIKTNDWGIIYNSLTKKVSASWDEVTRVFTASRGTFGQVLPVQALRICTKKGNFYVSPMFVDKSMPIPKLKYGRMSRKLYYPDGSTKQISIHNSDIYPELQKYIPEIIKNGGKPLRLKDTRRTKI